jgi:hypothetical protein
MCSCALWYFRVDLFSIFRVIALGLVKICNFQLMSHVTQKVFDLESWNLTGMLISMCSCAPGYFYVDIFSIFRVIALELVKISNFQLVAHVTKKVFDLESWNFTAILIRMCSCAPGYFHVDLFSIFRVITLDLVKICNFQLVSHETQKGFDLESWNFTGMLISICSCVIYPVFALDLVKTFSLCCVICSLSDWVRINQLYRNNDQHH